MIADPQQLERLQTVTREYSRFSQTALGLSWIVLAGFILISWRVCWGQDAAIGPIVFFIAAELWLATRQTLRDRLYQSFGYVQEVKQRNPKSVTNLIGGLIVGLAVVVSLDFFNILKIPWLIELAAFSFMLATAAITIMERLRHQDHSAAIGTGLIVAAVTSGLLRQHLFEWQQALQPVVIAFVVAYLIYLGIREHQTFKRLETQLKSFQGQP
jgi:multisubunit Na+/H+ antiporter MnhE subunit